MLGCGLVAKNHYLMCMTRVWGTQEIGVAATSLETFDPAHLVAEFDPSSAIAATQTNLIATAARYVYQY